MRRAFWLVSFAAIVAARLGSQDCRAESRSEKAEGTLVKLDDLQSRTPAEWKAEKPGNKMRAFQLVLPKAKGDKRDAELVIFYFGAGGGGSATDNVKRWKGMFLPPEGKSIDDVAKVTEMKVGKVPLTYLDVRGTYLYKERPFDPNAKVEKRPEHRLLGVVFESENGPYFIRLVGPAKTVEQHKKGFDDWLKAFK